MPHEPIALARRPDLASPTEADYDSFHATLSATERGRWFLGEHAARNRAADHKVLLATLDRIETIVRGQRPEIERMRGELRVLLDTMRLAQPDIEHTENASLKTAKLAALVNLLERRIEALVGEPALAIDTDLFAEAAPDIFGTQESADPRAHLSVVPTPDQPELPIPAAANDQMPQIALVAAPESSAAMTHEPVRATSKLIPVTVPDEMWPDAPVRAAAPAAQPETATLIGIEPDLHEAEFFMPSAQPEPHAGTEAEAGARWTLPAQDESAPELAYVPFEIEPVEHADNLEWSVPANPAPQSTPDAALQTAPVLENPVRPSEPAKERALAPDPLAPDLLAPLRALSEEELIALFS